MTTPAARPVDWRDWLPDTAAAGVVLGLGLYEAGTTGFIMNSRVELAWIALATAIAVGLSRHLPILSLGIVWLVCSYELFFSVPVMYVQAATAVVAFGTARWGRTITVFLSGLSIPAAGVLASGTNRTRDLFANIVSGSQYQRLMDGVQQFGTSWQIVAAVLGMAILGVPWLAGLTVRFSRRAAASRASQEVAEEEAARAHRESEQAREIARLREEQAQLAHDVHDVVGHSLAVILAQAESAQFLDEADTGALRLSMANIAASARGSLQDVRQVLTSTTEQTAGPGELHDLVEGVRASGHDVQFTQVGTPRPLAPELATVAYRVLQEMLTNAIRHGARDRPVFVDLHWSDELRITVSNTVGQAAADPAGGQGLDGMRRRLESVRGRLEVRPGDTFTTTAWVPVRTVLA